MNYSSISPVNKSLLDDKQLASFNDENVAIVKYLPQDFKVFEITDRALLKSIKKQKSGAYSIFMLEKTNISQFSAVKIIAKQFGIQEKNISFAGTKDKRAVTRQLISVKQLKRTPQTLTLEKENWSIYLTKLGYLYKPLSLGDLKGNKFSIIVRGRSLSLKPFFNKIPNYFHDQRFGVFGNNSLVGRLLVKGKFEKALTLIKKSGVESIPLPSGRSEAIKSLRSINKKLLRLYISAFQSKIFNDAVAKWVKDNYNYYEVDYGLGKLAFIKDLDFTGRQPILKLRNRKVILPGFGFEPRGSIGKYIEREMRRADVSHRDL